VRGYPLASVLALRAREAERARAELAGALDAVARRRSALERHDAAVAAHAERADAALRSAAGGEGPGALAARARWAARLRAELGALASLRGPLEHATAAAEREADARRAGLAAARGALRALEVHRDGWRAAEARRRDGREQDASDDLVSARRAAR
jgi:hypothetical protein